MSRRAPHSRSALRIARFLTVLVAVTAVVVGTVAPVTVATASAAQGTSVNLARTAGDPAQTGIVKSSLAGFSAGNIISDAVFTNKSTMTEAQIQSFFNGKVSRCQSGYVCLKDFRISSVNRPADAYCSGYTGAANESAARILYRVAQSCNINPQVLMVMLQKEQGLITHTWPSSWRYDMALGQGCPDTAPCDPNFVGFFHQIYGAARQMQIYMEGKWFQWYSPGKTWNLRYHPNASCGSSPVYVANKATAAMYYYTPYQPNAAALAAGYGEANNSCSSYGNRNFYNYFTDWFGSTQTPSHELLATAAIATEYSAQGGAGSLGAPTTSVIRLAKNGGGYGQAFAAGSIYWSFSSGAKTVRPGPVRDYYFARQGADGEMGWPLTELDSFPGGVAQLFTSGSLYSSSRGTYIVREPLRSGYFSHGGATGALRWPTAEQACSGGVCTQTFEGGTVVSSSAGSFGVLEPVSAAFVAAGGAKGTWGVPWTSLSALSKWGGGSGQAFSGGSVYMLTGGSPYFVSGAIRDQYFALGGADGRLGFPLGAQTCTQLLCQQEFQFGWILWDKASGARVGAPQIDAAFQSQGGSSGVLGVRVPGSLVYYSYNGGGMAEGFANGAIFYKRALGAFAVTGSVRDVYFAAGGAAGSYGWPKGPMTCSGGVCTQTFEGGTVQVRP